MQGLAVIQVAQFTTTACSWDVFKIKGHDFTQALMKNNIILCFLVVLPHFWMVLD